MKTMIDAVQYVERFSHESAAQDCLKSLKSLEGYIGGRVCFSPSYGEHDWLCQSFFEVAKDVNPEAFGNQYGMRLVYVPLSLLVSLAAR